MAELSVIVPYVNEWPQVVFTLRSLAEELKGIDFEIIAVSNFAPDDLKEQGIITADRGHELIPAISKGNEWLQSIAYTDKLSHWNAKNKGVAAASGDFLLFIDAHCVPGRDSIQHQYEYYKKAWKDLNGTLHLPLTYHIIEWHKLIYKLVVDKSIGRLRYAFSAYRDASDCYEVPCMSTCGMLMHRSIFDQLGGWPPMLGIYSGGEHFINFSMAILGMRKWVIPGEPLYHHGDRRGYSYNYDDYTKNRAIANYMCGGEEWLDLFMGNRKGHPSVLRMIRNAVVQECKEQRAMLRKNSVISIDEWIDKWK